MRGGIPVPATAVFTAVFAAVHVVPAAVVVSAVFAAVPVVSAAGFCCVCAVPWYRPQVRLLLCLRLCLWF